MASIIQDKELLISLAEDKIVNGGTWVDVAKRYTEQSGIEVTSDACRHAYANLVRDGELDEMDERILALKKQRVMISDERIQNNALIRQMAREETLKQIALEAVADVETRVKLSPTRIVTLQGA